MNTSAPTPGRLFVISAFALTCFGLLLFLWLAFGGAIPLKPEGYRVQVAFTDANTLADQADVRTAGVSIGKVVKKELDPSGNKTLTTIELKNQFAPLKADARAVLRQKTLLGETYVELSMGSKNAPNLPEGGRLRDARVKPAVEFDEFLKVFDEPTRKAFQEWQASVAKAGAGRGRDLSDALGNLPVFTENAQSVVDVLNDRRATLRALVHNAGRTFEQVTQNEAALTTLVQRNTELFSELSQRRDELATSIQILPTFLDESKKTLAALNTFSVNTEPLIRDLQPVLEDLQPTLVALRQLSPDLENLFNNIDPLITAGDKGLPALSRVLRGLDPTLATTGPFLQQLNPVLQYLELNQSKIADFFAIGPATLAGIRSTVPGSKSNGHVLPQMILLGGQSLPAITRSKDNRGNAYQPPNARRDPFSLALPAFDCANAGGEKPPTNTPGCKVATQPTFQGRNDKYPHVLPAAPGGVLGSGG